MKRRRRYSLPDLIDGEERFDLFFEGDSLYKAMLTGIAAARHSVWLETYIFADDEVGKLFADALSERAGHGVDVRVHLDAAGSLFWLSPGLVSRMCAAGVKVRWFHRWSWRHPLRYNRRDHRKLLVIDSRQAFLGGFNIHRENSLSAYGPERWRDTHVGVSGRLAEQAAHIFSEFWRGRLAQFDNFSGAVSAVLLTNHTRRYRNRLRSCYAEIFNLARESIFVTTPYFVPDTMIQRALLGAARRGVDVRLLLPARSDTRIAGWAARALYARLLKGGVRIYEYQPRMLHAKTATIDGQWSTVGTANLDYRSLFANHEINLFARDRSLSRRLQEQFFDDLRHSTRILAEDWSGRMWLNRLAEMFAWLLRRWL